MTDKQPEALRIAEMLDTEMFPPTFCLKNAAACLRSLHAENERLREAIAFAYGHLWHVNNEPAAPIPLRSPEKAAYEARKVLRDLLTTPERGNGIEQARAALAKEAT